MIFVSFGNAEQPFHRLAKAVETIVAEGAFGMHEVIVQRGHTPFFASGATVHNFLPRDEYLSLIQKADVVICHAGAGILLDCWKVGKRPVVMARLKIYGEHVDDHQSDLVAMLHALGWIHVLWFPEQLGEAVTDAIRSLRVTWTPPSHSELGRLVSRAIEEYAERRS